MENKTYSRKDLDAAVKLYCEKRDRLISDESNHSFDIDDVLVKGKYANETQKSIVEDLRSCSESDSRYAISWRPKDSSIIHFCDRAFRINGHAFIMGAETDGKGHFGIPHPCSLDTFIRKAQNTMNALEENGMEDSVSAMLMERFTVYNGGDDLRLRMLYNKDFTVRRIKRNETRLRKGEKEPIYVENTYCWLDKEVSNEETLPKRGGRKKKEETPPTNSDDLPF